MSVYAIQGEHGAFSHQAAIQLSGDPDVAILPCRSFDDLFQAVLDGDAAQGVVPVENTLAGAVQRAMDLLVRHPLHAVGETRVPIRLCLAAPPGARLEDLRTVASHPVALEQCHRFFREHPHLATQSAYDTAGSVKELMEGGAAWDAGIASALAARLYGAAVVAENIEDDAHNYTRFLSVSRTPADVPADGVKTSLAFTVDHKPGSLHTALGVLGEHGVDLSRIESRPIPGRPWEYRFYADLRGVPRRVQQRAVAALAGVTGEIRVLGCYPEVRMEG